MPRISSYTPAWLSRPSPGFDFFNKPSSSSSPSKPVNGNAKVDSPSELSKTIACRGTQVFTVVDNELRWSDLILLKERWDLQREAQNRTAGKSTAWGAGDNGDDEHGKSQYRVLKVPVSRKIRQILMSPSEDYLVIITSHTAHVAVLPDVSHLSSQDMSDLKLKAFQLGPTIHVMERSPISAVLWHPLGAQGSTLVTLTSDAVVRLWELDRKNRWSFDMPSLDFDLKKLANGQSVAEDFSPSKYGTSKGFSPDSFEMEVASASFGGLGKDGEAPWSTMTLWVAMKGGDIYALCPLLPSKWYAPTALMESLSTSIQCRATSLDGQEQVSKQQRRAADQQLSWILEIEKQQYSDGDILLQRPSYPGSIPKLQGPFQLAPDPDQDFDITDIHVLSPTVEQDSQNDEMSNEPLPISVELVCVATSDSKVHICANLETVEGAWLPLKHSSRLLDEETAAEKIPELLVIETIQLSTSPPSSCPGIAPDANSQNSIFISHATGVSQVDLGPLTNTLLDELMYGPESGIDFRVSMLVENSRSQIDHPIDLRKKLADDEAAATEYSACVDLLDPELGHFLMTVVAGQVHAVTLDDGFGDGSNSEYAAEAEIQGLISGESRPAYQPPAEFWAESTLSSFMEQHVHSRGRRFMKEEVRISPTTLNLLMEAHRVLSHETHRLGVAAADLFSRCERLQDEFREQVSRAREAAERVDAVLGQDADPYEERGHNGSGASPEAVAERLELVKATQETLVKRYDELRRKVNGLNGRALNEKEKAWVAEVESMDDLVAQRPPLTPPIDADGRGELGDDLGGDGQGKASVVPKPGTRFFSVRSLKDKLVTQAQEIEQATATATAHTTGGGSEAEAAAPEIFSISLDRRRAKLAEVNAMLERQTALVEATRSKLARLDGVPM